MKKFLYITMAFLMAAANAWSAEGINYNGTKLTLNNEFTRTECGTMKKNVINRKIVAVSPAGTLAMTVKINSGSIDRDDWEDIATGTYNGTNYIFIGAFGDNDLEFKDQYYIFYFEEPAITSGTQTIAVNAIRFGYPDNKAHNTETLLYDNVEQVFYIADKVKDGVCTLFSLPFRTDYGSDKQTLTKVTELGNGSDFNFLTAGDITPDGHWMAIKSKKYVLLWERQGDESESLAWLDNTTFYTTSDSKSDTPIYQYTRPNPSQGIDELRTDEHHGRKVLIDQQLYILRDEQLYNLQGSRIR